MHVLATASERATIGGPGCVAYVIPGAIMQLEIAMANASGFPLKI
jgi:hypothetical protein